MLGTFNLLAPSALAFDGANIWIADLNVGVAGNNVTKLRASDGKVLGTFGVGIDPFALAFDGENIWVANHTSSDVTKLWASDGKVLACS